MWLKNQSIMGGAITKKNTQYLLLLPVRWQLVVRPLHDADNERKTYTICVDGIQLANIPYEDRPARSGVTWSELEKALRCPRLRQNSFCCKFAVRPCDLSKGRGTS